MHQIRGLTDDELKALEDRAEAAVRVALQQVMDKIANRIAATQVASARELWTGCPHCGGPTHDGRCGP